MGWTQPDLAINTNFIKYNGKVYCAYCGKEITEDAEWDDYEKTSWYHCDCTEALKEIELTKKIEELNKEKNRLINECDYLKRSAKYKLVTKTIIEKIN